MTGQDLSGGTAQTHRRDPAAPTGRASMGPPPTRSPRPLRLPDALFLAALAAWALWIATATVLGGRDLAEAIRYLVPPAVLGGAVVLGRLAARGADAGPGAVRTTAALVLPAGLCLLAAGVLELPLYANAQAAAGVQVVALAALLLTTTLVREVGDRRPGLLAAGSLLLTVIAAVLGLALASRAQAGFLLVLAVAALAVLALVRPRAVRRRLSSGLCIAAVGAALAVVLALTSLPAWPRWLGEPQSLSFARQLLWRDALELWGNHPLLGGGPGSFYDSSPIARSEPHLYAAHSSVLQVGSELGTPAALLLLALLVLGVLLAAQADRARALIGVAAWSALAVHSMIDHLYEFPIVVLLAGVVIGWAGARPRHGARVPRPPGAVGPSGGPSADPDASSGTLAP